MTIAELVNNLLGVHSYTPDQINAAIECAGEEVRAYTHRVNVDTELGVIIARIAVIRLNKLGSEGASALNFSGVSESYIDGYPADIRAILNCKRLIKVL